MNKRHFRGRTSVTSPSRLQLPVSEFKCCKRKKWLFLLLDFQHLLWDGPSAPPQGSDISSKYSTHIIFYFVFVQKHSFATGPWKSVRRGESALLKDGGYLWAFPNRTSLQRFSPRSQGGLSAPLLLHSKGNVGVNLWFPRGISDSSSSSYCFTRIQRGVLFRQTVKAISRGH